MLRLFIACLAIVLPLAGARCEPLTASNALDGGHIVEGLQHWGELFPSLPVAHKAAQDIPAGKALSDTAISPDFATYIEKSRALGLVVLKDGKLAYEHYWNGAGAASRFNTMSLTKTLTALLVGAALADGRIASLDDPVARYVPALAGTAYGNLPLRALLTMSSGIAFDDSAAIGFWWATALRHDAASLAWAETALSAAAPNRRFNYSGLDTAVLGLVVEAATHESLAAYASRRLWQPIGAEDDASWSTDGAGHALAYCCFNARLRDLARLGEMLASGGGGILPADYLRSATTPARPELAPGALYPGYPLGYGFQLWLRDGPHHAFMGHGAYGQFLYVDPAEHLVIALASAWPSFWDYGLEAETYRQFDAIAAALR